MDDLQTDNQDQTVTDNQNGPETQPDGTSQDNGQAQGGAPESDLFKDIDPKKLPPEIKEHYNNMLRDYRDKTTKLAEAKKAAVEEAVSQYRQKADHYDLLSSNDDFVNMWNDYIQKQDGRSDDTEEMDPKITQLMKEVKEMREKESLREHEKITDAFADAVDEKGNKLNPDFDKLNEIIIGEYGSDNGSSPVSLLQICINLSKQKDAAGKIAEGYKNAKAIRDAIFEEGRKVGLGRVQKKLQNGTIPPSTSQANELSMVGKKPLNAREALRMARQGQMVSRED